MPLLFPHDPAIASLGAADHLWRAQPYLEICRMVLDRDHHTCIDCGIRIPGWMEIHHVNQDHDDFRRENLTAICHFCHLLHHPLQFGHFDHEPPLVLLRWPGIEQAKLQNLAWLLLYFEHGYELKEYDEVNTEKALLHQVSYPAIENHIKEIRKELELRQNKVGKWGGVTLASMLEYALQEGEPESWSELRFFPAGLVMPRRQLGLLSMATPELVSIHFLNPDNPLESAGIHGNPLLQVLHPVYRDRRILESGQERLSRHQEISAEPA